MSPTPAGAAPMHLQLLRELAPRAFARTCRNHLERQQADTAAWQELAGRNDEELETTPTHPCRQRR